MNLIKVKFLRNGKPSGRAYTYESPVQVAVGDLVDISLGSQGLVTEIDVPDEEIAPFRDKLKKIIGLAELSEEDPGDGSDIP